MTSVNSGNLAGKSTGGSVSRGRQRIFKLIMFSVMLVIITGTVLVAEYAARYREGHRESPPDYFPTVYYPHRRLRYGLTPNVDYYGWFKINSHGFRGREFSQKKPPGVFRIVCVGGSTTFDGGSVGKSLPWPEVLESELRRLLGTDTVEVLNLGIGGATSLDSLIDLQMRGLSFEPDLVIVYQTHNDLIYSIPQPYKEYSSLYPLEDRPRSSFIRWLTYNSLLYAKSEERVFGALSGAVGAVRKVLALAEPEPGDDRKESMERGLAAFRSNVRSIAAIAKANNLRIVFPEVTIPYPSAATEPCNQCEALSANYGHVELSELVSMFGRYRDAISKEAQAGGTSTFIPTTQFVPSSDRFYLDPVHYRPDGSRQFGTMLAQALVENIKQARANE